MLEQVSVRLDSVLDHMCEGGLDDPARMIRLLGRPISKARLEAVWHGRYPVLPEHAARLLLLEFSVDPIGRGERTGSLPECPLRRFD